MSLIVGMFRNNVLSVDGSWVNMMPFCTSCSSCLFVSRGISWGGDYFGIIIESGGI